VTPQHPEGGSRWDLRLGAGRLARQAQASPRLSLCPPWLSAMAPGWAPLPLIRGSGSSRMPPGRFPGFMAATHAASDHRAAWPAGGIRRTYSALLHAMRGAPGGLIQWAAPGRGQCAAAKVWLACIVWRGRTLLRLPTKTPRKDGLCRKPCKLGWPALALLESALGRAAQAALFMELAARVGRPCWGAPSGSWSSGLFGIGRLRTEQAEGFSPVEQVACRPWEQLGQQHLAAEIPCSGGQLFGRGFKHQLLADSGDLVRPGIGIQGSDTICST